MAFDANISPLNTFAQTGGGEGIRFFSYRTDDPSAAVLGNGYFVNCERYGTRLGDLIFVTPLLAGVESYITVAASIDSGGNVTVTAVADTLLSLPPSNGVNDEAALLAALLAGPVDGRGHTYLVSGGLDISSVTNPRLSNITLRDIAPANSSRILYFVGNHTNSLYLDHVIFDRGTDYSVGDVLNNAALWCVSAKLVEATDCEVYGGGPGKGLYFNTCDRVRCIRPHIHDMHMDWGGTGGVPEEQIEGIGIQTCTNVLISGHNIHRLLSNIQWAQGQIYLDNGVRVWHGNNSYKTSVGTSGAVPPTHTAGAVTAADGITYTYTGAAVNARAPQQTRGISVGASTTVLVEHGITTFVGQAVDMSGGGINRNITLSHNHYEDIDSLAEAFKHQIYGAKTVGMTCVRAGWSAIATQGDPPPEQTQSIGIYDYDIRDTGGINPVDGVTGGNWSIFFVCGIQIMGGGGAIGVKIGDGRIDDQQMETCTISLGSPAVITKVAHGKLVGDPVRFNTTGALYTGLLPLQRCWVVSTPTADTLTVSLTKGGLPIATSGTQSGAHTISMPTTEYLIRVEPSPATAPYARVQIGNVGGRIWKQGRLAGDNFDLHDVERFTFTPLLRGLTNATTGQVYTTQVGIGTRYGDTMEIEIAIALSTLGSGPGAGEEVVVDLNDIQWTFALTPFQNFGVRGQALNFTYPTYTVLYAYPVASTRTLKFSQFGDNVAHTALTWSMLGNTSSVVFNGRARIVL